MRFRLARPESDRPLEVCGATTKLAWPGSTGDHSCFHSVADIQLLKDVGHVVPDSLVAQAKLGADFLVAEAPRHQRKNFAFAMI